jgi:hypothetical protein
VDSKKERAQTLHAHHLRAQRPCQSLKATLPFSFTVRRATTPLLGVAGQGVRGVQPLLGANDAAWKLMPVTASRLR